MSHAHLSLHNKRPSFFRPTEDVDELQVFSPRAPSAPRVRGSKCLGGFHQGSIILRGLQAI